MKRFPTLFAILCWICVAAAQDAPPAQTPVAQDAPTNAAPTPAWHYGGFVSLAYLFDFNHPENGLFRSRGTTFHLDEFNLDMAALYVNKKASEQSRWGMELTVQAGSDSEAFGYSATAPNLPGSKWLRHLGLADVSYLAPVGNGLTIQGGIFGSLIGYDGLYAKDNLTYTRPWGADYTPYLMLGVNASYPFTPKLTGTLFVINGYFHLADANSAPTWGGQIAYKATPHVTLKQTVMDGSHQSNTALDYWRFLSDSLVEHRTDRFVIAAEYMYSSERVQPPAGGHGLMMAGQIPMHWVINKHWSATVRPEAFWDPDGRWTGARQTVKAITSNVEYRIPYRQTSAIFRLEHRYDDSRGPQGGFYRGADLMDGFPGLTPTQHLLIGALILTFDSP